MPRQRYRSPPTPPPIPAAPLVSESETKSESANDRFRRLANERAKKIIYRLRLFGQLGANTYKRTPEQVEALRAILQSELDQAISKLKSGFEEDLPDEII